MTNKNGQYTYRLFDCASAAEAEEWFLKISPKLIKVSPDGFPELAASFDERHDTDDIEPRLMNQWKRTVYDFRILINS